MPQFMQGLCWSQAPCCKELGRGTPSHLTHPHPERRSWLPFFQLILEDDTFVFDDLSSLRLSRNPKDTVWPSLDFLGKSSPSELS